jgi:hypothetical protein
VQPDGLAQLAGGTVVGPDVDQLPEDEGHPLRVVDVEALVPQDID